MKRVQYLLMALIGVPLAAWSVIACDEDSEAAEEIANRVDCGRVCQRYNECIDEIDITACTEDCEDEADESDAYEDAAEACQECLEGKACDEAESSGCWTDCPVNAGAN